MVSNGRKVQGSPCYNNNKTTPLISSTHLFLYILDTVLPGSLSVHYDGVHVSPQYLSDSYPVPPVDWLTKVKQAAIHSRVESLKVL